MKIRLHALAICVLAAAGPFGIATAQDATPSLGLLGARERLPTVFDAMSEARLKAKFLRCDHDSSKRLLDLDEAVPCAMAWDALLKRQFGGDVAALLAWWRAHREEADAR